MGLSRELKCARDNLDRWLNNADAPKPDKAKTYDVAEVVAYIGKNAPRIGKGANAADLKNEKLRLECERLTLDNEERKEEKSLRSRQLITREELEKTIPRMMKEWADLLNTFTTELPPQYQGKNIAECVEINAQAVFAIMKKFRDGVESIA